MMPIPKNLPRVIALVVAAAAMAGCSLLPLSKTSVVRFRGDATDSVDPATTGVMFLLDTDLDAETGVHNPGLGADYVVTLEAGPRRVATVVSIFV